MKETDTDHPQILGCRRYFRRGEKEDDESWR